MSILNRATLIHLVSLEKGPVNPALFGKKYNLPPSLSLAARFLDQGKCGHLKRVGAPKGSAINSFGKPSAWWEVSAKGLKYLKDHPEEIKTLEQLMSDCKTGGRPTSKNQGLNLNKKANTAIDSISQLIDDYNQSRTVLKQIHSIIGNYLNSGKAEIEE